MQVNICVLGCCQPHRLGYSNMYVAQALMIRTPIHMPADRYALPNPRKEPRPGRVTAEVIGLGNIRRVVDEFYERVREDPVLGPRFEVVSDWSEHKARIAHFWWVVLGGAAYESCRYRVVQTHRTVGVRGVEIEHWLGIFADCVRSSLPEPLAEAWLHRARTMGRSLSSVAGRV